MSSDKAFAIVGQLEIGRLKLRPGDALVVKSDRPVTRQTADDIREHLKKLLPPDTKVLVVDPGIELSVITKSQIEAASE